MDIKYHSCYLLNDFVHGTHLCLCIVEGDNCYVCAGSSAFKGFLTQTSVSVVLDAQLCVLSHQLLCESCAQFLQVLLTFLNSSINLNFPLSISSSSTSTIKFDNISTLKLHIL